MTKLTRRDFLKTVAASGLAAAVGAIGSGISKAEAQEERYGFLYNSEACIGCNACAIACKTRRGFPISGQIPNKLSGTTWLYVARAEEGKGPYIRHSCMHCGDPMCLTVCPAGAIKRWNGLVYIDPSMCIGCRYCVEACLYHVPHFNAEWGFGEWAPPNVSRKCDGCYAFVQKGKLPACVEVCPTHAIRFGKRSEMVALAKKIVAQNPDLWIYGLKEMGGLGVLYIFRKGFDPVKDGIFPEIPETYPQKVITGPLAIALAGLGGLLMAGYFDLKYRVEKEVEGEEVESQEGG